MILLIFGKIPPASISNKKLFIFTFFVLTKLKVMLRGFCATSTGLFDDFGPYRIVGCHSYLIHDVRVSLITQSNDRRGQRLVGFGWHTMSVVVLTRVFRQLYKRSVVVLTRIGPSCTRTSTCTLTSSLLVVVVLPVPFASRSAFCMLNRSFCSPRYE